MPQSASGKKWAGLVPYALDDFAIAFELTDQVANRYRSARVGEEEPTGAAALRTDAAQSDQACNRFRYMVFRRVDSNCNGSGGHPWAVRAGGCQQHHRP
ncbi:hypothetical protein ASH04_12125 [Rhodococcus sp. Leaf233]|nr:hypothetical protein ASH04_12125 [Rhodococcus sp. Leaf233]